MSNILQDAIAAKLASRIAGGADSDTQEKMLDQVIAEDKVKLNSKVRSEVMAIRKDLADARAANEPQVVIDMYSDMLVTIAGLAK